MFHRVDVMTSWPFTNLQTPTVHNESAAIRSGESEFEFRMIVFGTSTSHHLCGRRNTDHYEFTLNGEIGGLVAGEYRTTPISFFFHLFRFSFLTVFQEHGNLGFKMNEIVLIPLADVDFRWRNWV